MNAKCLVVTLLSLACLVGSMLAGTAPASARSGGFGFSTSGGSGGTRTGPTNFTGIYGKSSAAGSGGIRTGSTSFGA